MAWHCLGKKAYAQEADAPPLGNGASEVLEGAFSTSARRGTGELGPRDPSLGATRRRGAANEATRPGCRDSDDSGRRRRWPDQSSEPGRRLSDTMPVLHGQAHVRHGGGRRRTALARWHAEQVESALECAIRPGPEGRHGRAAALCASDGERACAATEAVVERKGGSVENRILRLDSLARACLALLNLYASVIP
eukprot:scaffold1434_cov134-Isochrysis_galbana.AAC.1